jgi:Bacterial protein of unknown function (DUF853).
VKAAAETFRPNPAFETEDAIMNLATGEALVSFLDEKGAPSVVERARMLFPLSSIGAITPEQRSEIIRKSRLYGMYEKTFDRESAYEILTQENKKQKELEEKKDWRRRRLSWRSRKRKKIKKVHREDKRKVLPKVHLKKFLDLQLQLWGEVLEIS